MITKVEIENFKRWKKQSFPLKPETISIIIGGNNSGKTTLLQALSVWAFCKVVIENEKGKSYLCSGANGKGYGINIDDFYPINLPSLNYLWHNLKVNGTFDLKIKLFWNDDTGVEKYLQFMLALVQERLFIKVGASNLADIDIDKIPVITHLTPFAGIEVKEESKPKVIRSKQIAKGLPGSVLRNEILELYESNLKLRNEKKDDKGNLSKKDLKEIRENDPYENLQRILFDTFKSQLYPDRFNPAFNSYIKIYRKKGCIVKSRFTPDKDVKPSDIMVEGSGFLQWLNVFTYAVSPNINVLLLDEPDAHLHPMLQVDLFNALLSVTKKFKKQVLIATHSPEIIKRWPLNDILCFAKDKIKYLNEEGQRISALHNIGSEYCPIIDKLKENKRLLLVENPSDIRYLQTWCKTLGWSWPSNITEWPRATKHDERKHLHNYLKQEIPDLKTLSLGDKDRMSPNDIDSNLKLKGYPDVPVGNPSFLPRCWQRHEIENYMLNPDVIARVVAAKRKVPFAQDIVDEVNEFLLNNHGLVVPIDFKSKNRTPALAPIYDADGHEVLNGICEEFHIKQDKIVSEMKADEIFDDVKSFLQELIRFCQ